MKAAPIHAEKSISVLLLLLVTGLNGCAEEGPETSELNDTLTPTLSRSMDTYLERVAEGADTNEGMSGSQREESRNEEWIPPRDNDLPGANDATEGEEAASPEAPDTEMGESLDAEAVGDGGEGETESESENDPWEQVAFPGECSEDPTCENTQFIDVSAGMFHTCAVADTHEILCWGANQDGQSTPPDLPFLRVWAGWEQTCGLTTEETVACWGLDSQGQSSPPEETAFQHLAIGRAHVCGVRKDATLECWGEDHQGMSSPPEGAFIQAAVGRYFSCALRTDGTPVCFGDDSQGTISGAPSGPFVQLVAGRWHVCGLHTTGGVECWGGNAYNQIETPNDTFTQLDAGWTHTCGIREDGSVGCWGEDHKGLLPPPTSGKQWSWISAGDTHNCGLQDGHVLCWGSDSAAQTSSPGETKPDAALCLGITCDDDDLCTADSCLAGVCYHPQIICDDGDPCTGEMGKDYCNPDTGLCQFPLWWDCDDGNACTNDLCDGTGGCSHTPHSDFCEDDDPCTIDDKCQGGQCIGIFNSCDANCVDETVDCSDGDPCTIDYCDPASGCLHEWIEDC